MAYYSIHKFKRLPLNLATTLDRLISLQERDPKMDITNVSKAVNIALRALSPFTSYDLWCDVRKS